MNRINTQAATALTSLALVFGLASSFDASASTSTNAGFDWSSFTVDVDAGSFAYTVDSSFGTTVTAFTSQFAPDFTTALVAGDAGTGVSAEANAKAMNASVESASGLGYAARSADVTRTFDFTLGVGGQVTFSIQAKVSTNDAAGPATTSFASLAVLGNEYRVSALTLTADGTDRSQSGLLSVVVTNPGASVLQGFVSVEGTATVDSIQAVPEPSTGLLMLPGLVVGGVMFARRRAAR